MSWGGYIPGDLLREIIEKEELRVFSEINQGELMTQIENILDEELWVTEDWNCSCCGTGYTIEDKDLAAKRIVQLFERVIQGDE